MTKHTTLNQAALPKIFCAIDRPDLGGARRLAQTLCAAGCGLKLGLEFFNSQGPDGVAAVMDDCDSAPLFLDLKYHDIPNTVAGAVRSICKKVTPAYLNLHASGGVEMMRAARDACGPETKMLGVTVLTSLEDDALVTVGQKTPAADQVKRLAELAQLSGLDGVVCSAHEIKLLRKTCGPDFVLMVPGIRPKGSAAGDQKRVMAPQEAMSNGATHLVIGRPITQAENPAVAATQILGSLK